MGVDPPPAPRDPAARRVRVVLADTLRARGREDVRTELNRVEQEQQSPVGETLVRGLVRAQLAVALRLAAVVAVGLGGLPLLFAFAPALARVRLFGVALPWLLLGVVAYPFLYLVGWAYVHLAERNEQEFAALVERRDR
jgi:fatty acid desaturase